MHEITLKEESVINRIYIIRGEKVMLDFDLAGALRNRNKNIKTSCQKKY